MSGYSLQSNSMPSRTRNRNSYTRNPKQTPEFRSSILAGDLVFYIDKDKPNSIPPFHVAIALDLSQSARDTSGLALLHAIPTKGVITTVYDPSRHLVIAVNPWEHHSKSTTLTQGVIDMAMRFVKPVNNDNYIPISYSQQRLQALESLQNASIPDKTLKTTCPNDWESYTQTLLTISHARFYGKSSENDYYSGTLAGHHTITAKTTNLFKHAKDYEKANIDCKAFSKNGMHCSQFALMVYQMAFKLNNNNYKSKCPNHIYLSRKHGHEKESPGSPKIDKNAGQILTQKGLPHFLGYEAKSISPAAFLASLMPPTPPSPPPSAESIPKPLSFFSTSSLPNELLTRMNHILLADSATEADTASMNDAQPQSRQRVTYFELGSIWSNLTKLKTTRQLHSSAPSDFDDQSPQLPDQDQQGSQSQASSSAGTRTNRDQRRKIDKKKKRTQHKRKRSNSKAQAQRTTSQSQVLPVTMGMGITMFTHGHGLFSPEYQSNISRCSASR